MIVFVDAYNVLKTMRGVDYVAPQDAQNFVRRSGKRAEVRGYQVVIVFDGGTGIKPTVLGGAYTKVIHAGALRTADDTLIELIETSHEGEKLLVTADRALRRRGILAGAQPVDPITYWRALHGGDEYEPEGTVRVCGSPLPQHIDVAREYTLEELKELAFSGGDYHKIEHEQVADRRRSSGRKESKAVKKFQKIKDRL